MGNLLGIVGTTMLLLAFVLNATGKIRISFLYTYLNAFGAGLAAIASFLIDFMPFVVLETVWFLAASAKLLALHRAPTKDAQPETTRVWK